MTEELTLETGALAKAVRFVREKTHPFFFTHHVDPVARKASFWAGELCASRDICEVAGYFHDIGYHREYTPEKIAHIERGIEIAGDFLPTIASNEFSDRVVDCIRTHDGHTDCNSQLENLIVNDADAAVFFEHPFHMFTYATTFLKMSTEEGLAFIKEHIEFSRGIMVVPQMIEQYGSTYDRAFHDVEMLR